MNDVNALGNQAVAVLLIPFLVRWLKASKAFPWLDETTGRANRVIAWGIGILAAAGIHYQADLRMDQSQLHLVFQWSDVTFASIQHAVTILAGQLGGQEVIYGHLKLMDNLNVVLKDIIRETQSKPPDNA